MVRLILRSGITQVKNKNKKKQALLIHNVVSGSNHFGIAGWYSKRASDHGMIVLYCLSIIKINCIKGLLLFYMSYCYRVWHSQIQAP